MSSDDATVWAHTDFPYMCLRDRRRTEEFRTAITAAVRAGDVVVELGAGSGILSLFAAASGAAHVVAVELDPVLARALRQTVDANGFQEVIEVIEGDALDVGLPRGVDVVIAEMIDTALIDEMQVPILNRLHRDGVILPSTAVIPRRYVTRAELVEASFDYYGMTVLAPKNLWPFYDFDETWHPSATHSKSAAVVVTDDDFQSGTVEPLVACSIEFSGVPTEGANALRLSGTVWLDATTSLGPTNALNGDKVIPLPERLFPDAAGRATLQLRWVRGGGLASMDLTLPIGYDKR